MKSRKLKMIDYEDMASLFNYDAYWEFKARAMNPEHPDTPGNGPEPGYLFPGQGSNQLFFTLKYLP